MIDLKVVLVLDFYDVDAVLASLLSVVAVTIYGQDSIFKYIDNEYVGECVAHFLAAPTLGPSGCLSPHWCFLRPAFA